MTASVIVCAYTLARAEQLAAAVRSVLAQTQPPDEVIVVSDHAPDLAKWARAHLEGVIVVESRFKLGLSGARNTGLQIARGDIVAFLDDDAVAAPEWLERLAAVCWHPRVVGAGGRIVPVWEDGRPGWLPEEFDWVVGCSYRGLPERAGPVRNVIGANMAFRRVDAVRAGGFATDLGRVRSRPLGSEETELCLRLGERDPGAVILHDPETVVWHAVPRSRATVAYFVARCFGEGVSKAEVVRRTGRRRGLATERSYALRVLPAGFGRAVREGAWARAGAILLGLSATIAGYAVQAARG